MTTTNVSVTSAWTQVGDTADASLFITWKEPVNLEVASTVANAAPTVAGHILTRDDAITRTIMGTGYVWARIASPNGAPAQVPVAVSK